jgi:hypothetical protein
MLSRFLTRPYRQIYETDDLGPSEFTLRNKKYERLDFEVHL